MPLRAHKWFNTGKFLSEYPYSETIQTVNCFDSLFQACFLKLQTVVYASI